MDYCKTCVYYPPSSCDGKPCTQCDPEDLFHNCYVNKEDYITKERMDERLEMMHKLYPDAKPTNADRIRSMTDEELANAFAMISDCISCNCRSAEDDCSIVDGTCQRQWLEWLEQEAPG